MVWRALYPPVIHFAIGQVVAVIGLLILSRTIGEEAYYQYALMLTGITGLLTLPPAMYLYKRDRRCRVEGMIVPREKGRLSLWEGLLLLVAGAALSQYVNLIVGLLMIGSKAGLEYRDTMGQITQGKGILVMILWMGIAAPVAEEGIFRWLVYLRMRDHRRVASAALLSGLFFGVYHGNLLQGIYATIMGAVFALLMEWSGSLSASALLHIGANIWSVILSEKSDWFVEERGPLILGITMILYLLCLAFTFSYFGEKYRRRGKRRLI